MRLFFVLFAILILFGICIYPGGVYP